MAVPAWRNAGDMCPVATGNLFEERPMKDLDYKSAGIGAGVIALAAAVGTGIWYGVKYLMGKRDEKKTDAPAKPAETVKA